MKGFLFTLWVVVVLLLSAPVVALVVGTPMSLSNQLAFGVISVVLLWVIGRFSSPRARLAMVLVTTLTASRYLYWRITETLVTEGIIESFLSMGLLAAEVYAWLVLVLSFFQIAWPLERRIVPLLEDVRQWPSVDVYIPTYNESLTVVRDTVLAAQNLDYPADKLNVYLLDDGKRPEFGAFASQAGVGYITRPDNRHAKAGNLNHAMSKTSGELICIFDCDHITTRAFLQATVGAFSKDSKLALIQTPHYFYSPDPFERNLASGRSVPHEGALFYGPVQKGNDYWNAAFFCGSCAVIRRRALDEVGGFAVETVTEDAHTALKLQRKGWDTAYLGVPLAAGLATERLSLHIVQRARWARGMTQILRRDNPLLGRGLTLPQRLCYLSAMLHFQFPLARFVFLTAPLVYLLFGLNIIQAAPQKVAVYVLPHLFAVIYTNAKLVGRFRYTFWNEIYETVLTFHLLKPSLLTLLDPARGKFDVTEKGGLLENNFFDFNVTRPHLFLLLLLMAGVVWGVVRLLWWNPAGEQLSVLVFNVTWASFSTLFLLAAIAVGSEQRQVRGYARIELKRPAVLHLAGGYTLSTVTENLSMGGIQLARPAGEINLDSVDFVEMAFDDVPMLFPVQLVSFDSHHIRLRFGHLNVPQRRKLVLLVMGRADAWLQRKPVPTDQPLRSIWSVMQAVAGLFFLRWKERKLFASANNDLSAAPGQSGGEAVAGGKSGVAWSSWFWWLLLVGIVVAGVLSTQRAWSQELALRLPLAAEGVLPNVRLGAEGKLRFDNPTVSRERLVALNGQRQDEPRPPLRLQGDGAEAGVEFSIPGDEVASSAVLYLSLRYSDELLEGVSQLQVALNGVTVETLALDRFTADGYEAEISIPPELILPYNTLLLSLGGETLMQCDNLLSDNIWAEVAPESHLTLTTQRLPASRDMVHLPVPFFDPADMERLVLPVVLPAEPSNALLRAATTVASHFALAADYRGADFPVHHQQLPDQHAVVLGPSTSMPLGVDLPLLQGPAILQVAHPNNALYRLLIITGRDDQEVREAATYLALREDTLAGRMQAVSTLTPPTSDAYDAPRWQNIHTPLSLQQMKEGDASNSAMVSAGVRPPAQRYSFRLPPNVFLWPGEHVTLNLEYRFPRGKWFNSTDSRLEVSLNDQYLGTLPVEKRSLAWKAWRLLGNDIRQESAKLRIPYEQLYGNNELSFYFNLAVNAPDEGCDLNLPTRIESSIDPGSHIDLRESMHFAALPELSYWLSAGFPFTQWADLSQTSLLLPELPSREEISAALGLVGRMGAATGTPGIGLDVQRGLNLGSRLQNRDVLVVAQTANLEASSLAASMGPFYVRDGEVKVASLSLVKRLNLLLQARMGTEVERAIGRLDSEGASQVLMGFASPLNAKRQVVVATAFEATAMKALPTTLERPLVSREAVGDLVLIRDQEVAGFRVGSPVLRGEMAWHRIARWFTGQYIIPMLLAMGLVVVLIAGVLYSVLRRRACRRATGVGR